MIKLFAVFLLGLFTNGALGRYETYSSDRNYNYYPKPLPPISESLPPIPVTLPPISLPPVPQPLPPVPQLLPPVPEPLPPIPDSRPLPPIPDYSISLPPAYSQYPIYLRPIQPNDFYGNSLQPSKYQSRYKRQANEDEDMLEERYNLERPGQNWFQRGPGSRQNRPGNRPFPRPGDNQGFPNSNQGFPNSNQGFPNSNQGFPNSNQGFPNSNQGFPNTNQGFPNTNQGSGNQNQGQQNLGQVQPNQNGSTTEDPSAACISACLVTPEYNPVCGSNGVTYPNPGRLICAQQCGVAVNLSRQSPCPTTTTSTAAPQN